MGLCAGVALADGHEGDGARTNTVLAKVGEVEITVGHVLVAIEDVNPQQRQMSPEALFANLLEQLVQQEQLAQQLTTISALTQLQMENERRSLLATQVVEGMLAEINVSEAETRRIYQQRYGAVTENTEFNASHILVDSEEEAKTLAMQLAEGADFGSLAQAHSTGPSGPSGGNLGWFGQGRMLPAFEAAVKAMQVGTVSEPVQTEFGWHVIRLNDSRVPNVPSYEDLQPQLEREVMQTRFRAGLADVLIKTPVQRFDSGDIDPVALLEMLSEGPMNE
jgi:peptidyl-prolyl cis-trans isomerase C